MWRGDVIGGNINKSVTHGSGPRARARCADSVAKRKLRASVDATRIVVGSPTARKLTISRAGSGLGGGTPGTGDASPGATARLGADPARVAVLWLTVRLAFLLGDRRTGDRVSAELAIEEPENGARRRAPRRAARAVT